MCSPICLISFISIVPCSQHGIAEIPINKGGDLSLLVNIRQTLSNIQQILFQYHLCSKPMRKSESKQMDEVLILKYSLKKEIGAEMPTEILFTVQSVRSSGNRKWKIHMWWELLKHPLKFNSTSVCAYNKVRYHNLSFLKILFLPRTAHTLDSWSDLLFQNASFPTTQYRIDIAISTANSIFILFWPPAILSHSKLREVRNFL